MKTEEESVCCREIKIIQERFQGVLETKISNHIIIKIYFTDLDCICSHPLVKSILDKEMLR